MSWFSSKATLTDLKKRFKEAGKRPASGRDASGSRRQLKRLGILVKLLGLDGDDAAAVKDFVTEQRSDVAFAIDTTWTACQPNQGTPHSKLPESEVLGPLFDALKRLLTRLPELFRDGWMATCVDQILAVLLHPGTPARYRSQGMRLSVRWLSCLAGAGPTSPHTAKAIGHFSAARFDRVRQPGQAGTTPMPGRDDGPAELDQATLLTELLDEILQTSEDSDATRAFERFLYLHELWVRQYLAELYPSSCETLPKSPLGTAIERLSSVDLNELFAAEQPETFGLSSRRSSTRSLPGPPNYEEALKRLDNSTKLGSPDPADVIGGADNAAESIAATEAGADTGPRPPSLDTGPAHSPWPEGINPQVALRAYAAVEQWYINLFSSTKIRSRALVGFLLQQSGIIQITKGIFQAVLGGSYDLCRRDDIGPDKYRVVQASRVIGIYHEWTSAKVVLQAPQMAEAQPPPASDDLNPIEEDCAAAGPATNVAPTLLALTHYESIGAAHCVWLMQEFEEDPTAKVHFPGLEYMLALHGAICTMLSELFLPWWSSASSDLVAEDYAPLLDEATCIYQLMIVQSLRVDSAGAYLGAVVDSLLTSSAIILSEIEMVSQGDRKPRILRKDSMVVQLRRLLTTAVMGWYRMALQVSADALDDSCASIRPFLGKFARIIGEGDSHALSIWSKIIIDLTQAIVNKSPAIPMSPSSKGARDGRGMRDSRPSPREHAVAANLSPTGKGSPEPSRQSASSPRARGGSFRSGSRSKLRSHPSSTRSPATPHGDLHPGMPQESTSSSRPLIGSLLARVTSSPWTPAPASTESSLIRSGLPKGRIAEVKAEFLDVSAETAALDVETLKRIWLCTYSLPGDINGMPPEMQHNCLKTLMASHMLFGKVETSGLADIYARGDPRLPAFLQELLASVELGEPYARSRSLACQLLCKVLFRRDVVTPLPQETASAMRDYVLRILRGSDINMKQSLISSCPLFFSSGLAKAMPMLFDYISAAKAVLFSHNTVLLMSVIGDASDDTQSEAKLLSPKETAMSILCSLASVVKGYSLRELKELWGSIERRQAAGVDAASATAPAELPTIGVASDAAAAATTGTPSGPVQSSLSLTVVEMEEDLLATAADVQHDLTTTLKRAAMDLPEVQVRLCALNGLCCTVYAALAREPIASDDSVTLCLDTLLAFTGNLEVGQAAVAHIDGLVACADAIARQHPGYINTVVDVLRERIRVLFDRPQRDSAGDATLIQSMFCLRNWLVTGHVDRPNHEVAFKLLNRVCGRVNMSSEPFEWMPSPPRASVRKVVPKTAALSPERRRKADGRTGAVLPENIRVIEGAIHDIGEDTPKLVMGRSPSLSRRKSSMASGNLPSSKRERRLQRASSSTKSVKSEGGFTAGSSAATVRGVDHVRQVAEIVVAHVACRAHRLGGQLPEGLCVATKDAAAAAAGDIASLYFACHGTVLAISQVGPVVWKVVVRSVSQRSSHVINVVGSDTDTAVGPEVSTGDMPSLSDRTHSEPLSSKRPPPLSREAVVSDADTDERHQSAPAVSTVQFDFVIGPSRDRSVTANQASQSLHAARYAARAPTAETIDEVTPLAISPEGPIPVSSEGPRSGQIQIPWASISELMSQLGLVSEAHEARFAPIPWTKQLQSALRREQKDPRPVRDRHKIGVIYVGPGQTTKHDMISGQSGDSEDFDAFVAGLGSVVRVGSHTGYTGGLAPEFDQCDMPYYADYDVEAVFHVSTLMASISDESDGAPSTEADPEELARKLVKRRWRHIGNDDVHIIWCENRGSFNVDPLASDFGIVSIVIHLLPDLAETCWVQILVKESAPRNLHGPLVHGAVVKLALLPGLIRTTALNIARQIRSEYLKKNSLQPYYVLRADWLRDVLRLQDIGAGRPMILLKATSLPDATPPPSVYRLSHPQPSFKRIIPATKESSVAATLIPADGSIALAATPLDSNTPSDSPPPVAVEDPYGDAWAALVEQTEEVAALVELAALADSIAPQPARQPAIPGCDTSTEDGYRLKLISLFEDAAPTIEACFDAVSAAAGVSVDRFDNSQAAKGGVDYAATLDFAGSDCVCESVGQAVAALRHLVQTEGGSELTVLRVDNALALAPASAVASVPATAVTAYKELSVVCSVPDTALCVLLRVHLAALRNATSNGGAELSPASDPLRRRIQFDREHASATSES